MAADKRTPRRGAGGGGFGGGGRPGGGGGRGGRQGGWQPRPPREPNRPDRSGRARGPLPEPDAPWQGRERPTAGAGRGPGPMPGPRPGRWEAVDAETVEELAQALNALHVQPEHLVHLEQRIGDPDLDSGSLDEGWVALVWVQ